MKVQASAALVSATIALGLGFGGLSAAAAVADQFDVAPIQYRQYPDQGPGGYYPNDRYYPGERQDGYQPYPQRDGYSGPLWRPGQVLPDEVVENVVFDWEERGLSRPPGGHRWVRAGYQFILVRDRDRMIARTINFD